MKIIVAFIGLLALYQARAFEPTADSSAQTLDTVCWNDSLVRFAQNHLGTPYVYGGSSPKGFDCSGFVRYVFQQYNCTVPRSSSSYHSFNDTIPLKEIQVGDILVFTGTNAAIRKPGHLGIVTNITENEIIFIHSSSSKKHSGVVESKLYTTGYRKRYIKTLRLLP
ncbi:Cell wall-associated hydrolase, NlpC family [Lishizhenia tianjinensis]|uniref:Cell wall-associated hydrolase, NlpC family n=1 Tax=Lishizhenia tianjinensis TaxID=477690 RepID=A0A1I7ADG2_9FLAO|nr:C40 family peptidase [Lishizhenia tianjinensis]SFT72954.1 Cell wall-associated hydrolase, NlpC family [Lishizhenia tianjinensis]